MKILQTIGLITLLMLSVSVLGQDRDRSPLKYGEIWNEANDLEKILYVRGYMEGATAITVQILEELGSRDIKIPQTERAKIGESIKAADAKIHLERDFGTLIPFMDQLYKDPYNLFIPFNKILNMALSKYQGTSDAEIAKRLDAYRKAQHASEQKRINQNRQ